MFESCRVHHIFLREIAIAAVSFLFILLIHSIICMIKCAHASRPSNSSRVRLQNMLEV
jgi:hypothetical protein